MIIPAGRALKVIETTTVLELRHERKCRYEKSWVSTNGLKDERLVVESHMVQYFVLFVSLLVKTLSRLIWSWNVDFWEILSSVLSFSIFVENGPGTFSCNLFLRKEVIGNINITEENQKFFQWQRANIGGTYNKHSVTNAVENYFLETIHEEPWAAALVIKWI